MEPVKGTSTPRLRAYKSFPPCRKRSLHRGGTRLDVEPSGQTNVRTMKPAHTYFRDQVKALVGWFSNWNECEQTIALYTLLKRISTTQARFLSLILQHTFRDDNVEVQILQNRANDKEFVTSLCQQSKEEAVKQLLALLPLLIPGNDEARFEYLQLLPKILTHSVEHCVHQEECMQLLSLALVHPAFPQEERNSLLKWLSHLEKNYSVQEQQRSQLNRHGTTESDIQPNTGCENLVRARNYKRTNNIGWTRKQPLTHKDSGLGSSFDSSSTFSSTSIQSFGSSSFNYGPGIRKCRSNSLTPPPVMDISQDSILEDFNEEQEVEIRPGRSRSFPVDPQRQYHQLSPQSSTESEQDDFCMQRGGSFNEEARPGMKDVHGWLKSLRLHKYDSLFQQISYEEMMALDEKYLESKGVTKGARNKILLSIQKLSDRQDVLQNLEKDVLQVGKLQDVLNEMKQILITPIKSFTPLPGPVTAGTPTGQGMGCITEQPMTNGLPHPEDLPSQITRVLGKACTQILVSRADEDNCTMYLHLLDRALGSEAFTMTQKKRFQSWKQQCQKLVRSQFSRRPSQEKGPRGWCHMSHGSGDSSIGMLGPPAGPGGQTGKRHGRVLPRSNKERPAGQMRSNSAEQQTHQKPQLTRSHAVIGRTKSLPVKPTQQHSFSLPQQLSADFGDKDPSLDGIDNSFETLCLSVTEHALEDSGGN